MSSAAFKKRFALALCFVVWMDSSVNATKALPRKARSHSRLHDVRHNMAWLRPYQSTVHPYLRLFCDHSTLRFGNEKPLPTSKYNSDETGGLSLNSDRDKEHDPVAAAAAAQKPQGNGNVHGIRDKHADYNAIEKNIKADDNGPEYKNEHFVMSVSNGIPYGLMNKNTGSVVIKERVTSDGTGPNNNNEHSVMGAKATEFSRKLQNNDDASNTDKMDKRRETEFSRKLQNNDDASNTDKMDKRRETEFSRKLQKNDDASNTDKMDKRRETEFSRKLQNNDDASNTDKMDKRRETEFSRKLQNNDDASNTDKMDKRRETEFSRKLQNNDDASNTDKMDKRRACSTLTRFLALIPKQRSVSDTDFETNVSLFKHVTTVTSLPVDTKQKDSALVIMDSSIEDKAGLMNSPAIKKDLKQAQHKMNDHRQKDATEDASDAQYDMRKHHRLSTLIRTSVLPSNIRHAMTNVAEKTNSENLPLSAQGPTMKTPLEIKNHMLHHTSKPVFTLGETSQIIHEKTQKRNLALSLERFVTKTPLSIQTYLTHSTSMPILLSGESSQTKTERSLTQKRAFSIKKQATQTSLKITNSKSSSTNQAHSLSGKLSHAKTEKTMTRIVRTRRSLPSDINSAVATWLRPSPELPSSMFSTLLYSSPVPEKQQRLYPKNASNVETTALNNTERFISASETDMPDSVAQLHHSNESDIDALTASEISTPATTARLRENKMTVTFDNMEHDSHDSHDSVVNPPEPPKISTPATTARLRENKMTVTFDNMEHDSHDSHDSVVNPPEPNKASRSLTPTNTSSVHEVSPASSFVKISSTSDEEGGLQLEYGLTSDTTGYIQSPGYDGKTSHLFDGINTRLVLQFDQHDVIVVSFPRPHVLSGIGTACNLILLNGTERFSLQLKSYHKAEKPNTAVYHTRAVTFKFGEYMGRPQRCLGFKLIFSVHKRSEAPQILPDGTWNCAVPHWASFKQHVYCDFLVDCADGRDESQCLYHGLNCRPGQVELGARCYRVVFGSKTKSAYSVSFVAELSRECRRLEGGQLASLNTPGEWAAVDEFLKEKVGGGRVTIGLRTAPKTLHSMYTYNWQHSDGTIAYYIGRYFGHNPNPACLNLMAGATDVGFDCMSRRRQKILCEFDPLIALPVQRIGLQPPPAMPSSREDLIKTFIRCPHGHFAHRALACHVDADCWSRDTSLGRECDAPMTPLPPDFQCANGVQGVPYALVCDFRSDCSDESDEEFCTYPVCNLVSQFECSNKQCVSSSAECDGATDCIDGSDESLCNPQNSLTQHYNNPPPATVDFTANGALRVRPMSTYEKLLGLKFVCPNTHFQCPNDGFCLPVFLYCNGVKDCPRGEDEVECDSFTCGAGFYRCRRSRICILPQHLCDGLHQCPLGDDELHCITICPDPCTCYGDTLFCNDTFEARQFKFARYLDADGSGLSTDSFHNYTMLIHLSLARCQLKQLALLNLPSLHVLDLSDNDIAVITLQHLTHLPHLRWLSLAGNPIRTLFAGSESSNTLVFSRLRSLDLAGVRLSQVSVATFTVFPNLRSLNLSSCGLDRVAEDGPHVLAKLRVLDLRGCPVTHFPRTVFQGWDDLSSVLADNYKLCCPSTLPSRFNPANCKAPLDEVSSCQALLRSDVYRVFLSLFSALALLGNLVSLVARLVCKRIESHMGFDVFVANLCVSDFIMGVYLAIIGAADRVYLGTYQWDDLNWRHSAACKVAGFLSLLSSEVSAFIICLITLDRFLAVKFPLSQLRFKRRSALVTCGALWMVGIALAAVPLMPAARHWDFYSQKGICIPLPVTRHDFAGHHYMFGVMIVLNFVLFLLIALGQLVIYWAVQTNSIAALDASQKSGSSRELKLARRLIAVAMSDFLCWFPIGLLGLLTATGTPVSGEVNVAIAIFVLPLNSAINPFLYTFNMLMERIEEKREDRLRRYLLARLQAEAKERIRQARVNVRRLHTASQHNTEEGAGTDIAESEGQPKEGESSTEQVAETTIEHVIETSFPQNTESSLEQGTETPLKPDTDIPLEQDTDTHLEQDTDTPLEQDTDTPLEQDTATPLEEDTAPPLEDDTATPLEDDTATPLEEDTAPPLEDDTATPLEEDTATPLKQDTATP